MNKGYENSIEWIRASIKSQQNEFENSLILNPVENIPFADILVPNLNFLHGLYNTDTPRNDFDKKQTKIQFSGRDIISSDVVEIYKLWSQLLGAKYLSMRLLSGLHAHIILLMALTEIGDRIVVLPEIGGGHTSGIAILKRLGLNIAEMFVDNSTMCVDTARTQKLIEEHKPHIIFVDRSEGLIYEDFSWLKNYSAVKIFDASQYLTNIMCGDYTNPFQMGFDIMLSTLHKNLPGPQRALICCENKEIWGRIKPKISTYVSNMHVFTIYSAGLLLGHMSELQTLSKRMLCNALTLEKALLHRGVPVIKRNDAGVPTHHCWIKCSDNDEAYHVYLALERLGLLVNYRLLPYNIGYGLRLGTSGATMSGLNAHHIEELADLISHAYIHGYSDETKMKASHFIGKVKSEKL